SRTRRRGQRRARPGRGRGPLTGAAAGVATAGYGYDNRRDREADMQHDELIGQVQARARLSSSGAAERAVRSTLETLGERLPEGLADNLAAQLPQEIGEHLYRTETMGGLGTGARSDRDESINRASERSGTDRRQGA